MTSKFIYLIISSNNVNFYAFLTIKIFLHFWALSEGFCVAKQGYDLRCFPFGG